MYISDMHTPGVVLHRLKYPVLKCDWPSSVHVRESYTCSFALSGMNCIDMWGVGGALVESTPNCHGFDFRSSRLVGTLGKSFTHSCLWRFDVKFQHSIRAVSERFRVVVDLKRRQWRRPGAEFGGTEKNFAAQDF